MINKLQSVFSLIGFFFMTLYVVYVGGYSDSFIFKYCLVIALVFFTADLILYLVIRFQKKEKL